MAPPSKDRDDADQKALTSTRPLIDLERLGEKFVKQYLALFFLTGEVKYVRKHLANDLHTKLLVKLKLLYFAQDLREIGKNPGNKLKPMKGKYAGRYSIRLNHDYRILFSWHAQKHATNITLIHRSAL